MYACAIDGSVQYLNGSVAEFAVLTKAFSFCCCHLLFVSVNMCAGFSDKEWDCQPRESADDFDK